MPAATKSRPVHRRLEGWEIGLDEEETELDRADDDGARVKVRVVRPRPLEDGRVAVRRDLKVSMVDGVDGVGCKTWVSCTRGRVSA